MPENNISNEQQKETSEPEDLEIQMALPVAPTPTYSSVPEGQRQHNVENVLPTVKTFLLHILLVVKLLIFHKIY